MTAVGFATFLSALQLSDSSILFTLGLIFGGGFFFAVGAHMLLAFPTGRVESVPEERLPGAVEAAAYFVVAESLTNVAKYAEATHAEVRVGRADGVALIEVRDDGVGGADPARGTGLRGLADRLAALDGRLEVSSPPGEGTVVRAEVPCA